MRTRTGQKRVNLNVPIASKQLSCSLSLLDVRSATSLVDSATFVTCIDQVTCTPIDQGGSLFRGCTRSLHLHRQFKKQKSHVNGNERLQYYSLCQQTHQASGICTRLHTSEINNIVAMTSVPEDTSNQDTRLLLNTRFLKINVAAHAYTPTN